MSFDTIHFHRERAVGDCCLQKKNLC